VLDKKEVKSSRSTSNILLSFSTKFRKTVHEGENTLQELLVPGELILEGELRLGFSIGEMSKLVHTKRVASAFGVLGFNGCNVCVEKRRRSEGAAL